MSVSAPLLPVTVVMPACSASEPRLTELVPLASCRISTLVTLVNAPSTTEAAAEKIRVSVSVPPSMTSTLPSAEGAMVTLSAPARLVKLVVAVMPEESKLSAFVVPAASTMPVPLIV